MQFLVLIHRNTTAVVLHGYRIVLVYSNFYVGTESGHSLIDRVVYGLVHQMVKTLLADVAYIHRRALAHCLQSFKHLYVTG